MAELLSRDCNFADYAQQNSADKRQSRTSYLISAIEVI